MEQIMIIIGFLSIFRYVFKMSVKTFRLAKEWAPVDQRFTQGEPTDEQHVAEVVNEICRLETLLIETTDSTKKVKMMEKVREIKFHFIDLRIKPSDFYPPAIDKEGST